MLLGGNIIKAIDVSMFRKSLKENLDSVFKNKETLIVNRPENENVVVISEDSYNDFIREINNLKYILKLKQAEEEIEQNEYVTFDL